ncbi:hypothetical protein [Streptosporangium sp. CA-115845]|uniref:hypothetical protein n=1 Tax=Streptosporangium sp. CA-115845 TaxID=3240071 RepID=UPI003D922820
MFVLITNADPAARVSVEEADDCTRLHVSADGLDDTVIGEVLRSDELGLPGEPGRVWLDVTALHARARAGVRVTDWDDRFNAMLDHARGRGWLNGSGTLVAAHIVREEP